MTKQVLSILVTFHLWPRTDVSTNIVTASKVDRLARALGTTLAAKFAEPGAGDLILAPLPHLLAYELLEERVYPGSGFNGRRFSKYCRALSSRSS